MDSRGKILWLEQIQNSNKTFAFILDARILDNIFINNKNNKLLNNYALQLFALRLSNK
jgi:endo-beta-N-acetylglucosaminidase D